MGNIETCQYCGSKYVIKEVHVYPIKDVISLFCPKCNKKVGEEKTCAELKTELVE